MTEFQMITEPGPLGKFADRLAVCDSIAVDLEADSMHHYSDKVCLLQFTAGGETALVDPLALPDLEPLRPVLADPGIRKLFHAADYDLRSLRRDFDLQIDGLVDTMLAAQFCGEERIGLADLLAKYFGVELDKKFQRADWSIRPLPEGMLHYAAEDTRHLDRLAELLLGRLADLGRLDWLQEECRLLETVRFDPATGPLFLRFKGAAKLDRRQLAILEELLQWRDRTARQRDLPPFKVIGNQQLLAVAQTAPATKRALAALPDLPPRLAQRYASVLLESVARGMALPAADLPFYPRGERRQRDPAMERRLDRLKQWRTTKAAELQLEPGVLINNAMLEAIAKLQPRSVAELDGIDSLRHWQRRIFGADLVAQVAT